MNSPCDMVPRCPRHEDVVPASRQLALDLLTVGYRALYGHRTASEAAEKSAGSSWEWLARRPESLAKATVTEQHPLKK